MSKKVLLMCLITLTPSFAIACFSGFELLDDCQVAMDVFDYNAGRIQMESEYQQGSKAGKCLGFLMGVNEMYLSNQTQFKYCLPSPCISTQGVIAVVHYLKRYPQLKPLPASQLVLNAFATYFPCR